jgi:tripartite motif-containing protein 71
LLRDDLNMMEKTSLVQPPSMLQWNGSKIGYDQGCIPEILAYRVGANPCHRLGTDREESMAGSARTDAADQCSGESESSRVFRRQLAAAAVALGLLLLSIGAAYASANEENVQASGLPTSADVIQAIEAEEPGSVGVQLTDPQAAEELPHSDLEREEALQLLQGVFEAQLQAPAGVFDELDVKKFLAPNLAVISGDEPPFAVTEEQEAEPPGSEGEEEPEGLDSIPGQGQARLGSATLLESSVPLRTEAPSGEQEVVDLSLEHSEGELQPANPLVEVGIPQELGEGIELPGVGVKIELAGAPEDRSPSMVDQSVGFLPNVATDTDLAVAPTPIGVETLTQMRSADSPHSQTFNLDLPAGAALEATEDGGAAVLDGEETLLTVAPPTAIDATGAKVPVSLNVSGDSLTLTVDPGESSSFPILLDPLFQTYEWAKSNYWQSGICNSSFEFHANNPCNNREEWGYEDVESFSQNHIFLDNRDYSTFSPVPAGTPGLFIETNQSLTAGNRGSMIYTVPRYFTDPEKYKDPQGNGIRPTSFISHMTLWNVDWNAYSSHLSPYLFAGIWDAEKQGWVSVYSHEGLTGHSLGDMNYHYQFENDTNPDARIVERDTHARVGYVSVQATETQTNQNTEAYVGSASIELTDNDVPTLVAPTGPSQWSNQTAQPAPFTAGDSGLGVYSLTASEEMDKGVQHTWKTPYGCIGVGDAACPRVWDWTEAGHPALKYEPSVMPQGIDYINVAAEDPLGNKSESTGVPIGVDHTAPRLAISGSLTEQGTLGAGRPQYALKYDAADGGLEPPTFSSSFGSLGAGNGQFNHPGDIAVDSKGNLWVADANNNRVEKFGASGEYLTKFGTTGSGNGQLKRPTALAIDAKGNIWVADAGNSRIEQFNEKGEYVSKFGSLGAGEGQLNSAEGVAIDPKGNIWVADTYNGRVQKFNEKGEFVKVVGSKGSGTGQLGEPTSIDVGLGGRVLVADWQNNRVAEFNESGGFVRQFGAAGSGNGQFKHPDGIEVDSKGDVWVGDQENGRVQAFTEGGEYVTQFGLPGSGAGQLSLSYPTGIATDSKGGIWITDSNNNRVQKWLIPKYVPSYSSSFGSAGAGDGQFNRPADVALDSKGNIWVADESNNRIEKFNASGAFLAKYGPVFNAGTHSEDSLLQPSSLVIDAGGNVWITDRGHSRVVELSETGELLRKFGSSGAGNGQFAGPEGIAVDAKGNLWVSDTLNGRLQEFNEKGEFMKVASSKGSGTGQLGLPAAIAIGIGGTIWVADYGNNRVAEFNKSGEFVRQFGTEGSGEGQFKHPDAIEADAKGNIWVSDLENSRIEGFNQSGEYVTQVGSKGSGSGKFNFSSPMGLATDSLGNIWITDTLNNRVQKWNQPGFDLAQSGVASTAVKVDGKTVDSTSAGCPEQNCSVSRTWTLDSSAFAEGPHWVEVTATDGVNLSTSKTLFIMLERDTTAPQLTANSEFFTAPEGWLEQKSYPYMASATDADGYGVTSLVLKIDGKAVQSTTQSCPSGNCQASLSNVINMSSYGGGAHPAELIATDGAGNVTKKAWTINVDPKGPITATEAEETLEAVDDTSESTIVASTEEVISAEERADGNDPSLVEGENGLESEGTPDQSTISSDPKGGFTVELPEGSISAKPVQVGEGATSMIVAEEAVAVGGNSTPNVDSVIRPIFNGLLTFGSIRDASAPETFSWEVNLGSKQVLRSVDPLDAEVDYEDGHEAYLITAEPAADAVGTTVPTSLSVSEGNIITLTVQHKEGTYVYPVVAGAGWEGGFTTEIVKGPKDQQEIKEEEERLAREKQEALEKEWKEGEEPTEAELDPELQATAIISTVGPPEMVDFINRIRRSKAEAGYCSRWFFYPCSVWKTVVLGSWFWNGTQGKPGGYAWRGNTTLHCNVSSNPVVYNNAIAVGWAGGNPAPYGYGEYLNEWCNFETAFLSPEDTSQDVHRQIQNHLFGDGYQNQHIHEYGPLEAG